MMDSLGAGILDTITAMAGNDVFPANSKVFYPGIRLCVIDHSNRVMRGNVTVREIVGDRLICDALPVDTEPGDLLVLPIDASAYDTGNWENLQRS